MKIDKEDLGYALAAMVIAVLGKQISRKQSEKAFHRSFEKEMSKYQLEDKKGGQE